MKLTVDLDNHSDIRAAIVLLQGLLPTQTSPGNEVGLGPAQRSILTALRAQGAPMTNSELRLAGVGTSDDGNLSNSLHGLQQRRLVERVQRGLWRAL